MEEIGNFMEAPRSGQVQSFFFCLWLKYGGYYAQFDQPPGGGGGVFTETNKDKMSKSRN